MPLPITLILTLLIICVIFGISYVLGYHPPDEIISMNYRIYFRGDTPTYRDTYIVKQKIKFFGCIPIWMYWREPYTLRLGKGKIHMFWQKEAAEEAVKKSYQRYLDGRKPFKQIK